MIREVEGLIEETAASASLEQARALAAEGDYPGMEPGDFPDDRAKVEDTPADYRLEFDCGGKPMAISIAPLRGSGLRGLWALANGGAHRLRRMLPFFGGEPEYVVNLDRNGAQELYCALNPGDFAIIR